ncbi:MAG: alpha/beta fold hydrolase [Acidimicrobiales bacterium]
MAIVDNNGTDIFYEVVGSGPPLILHHGRLGSGDFWREYGYASALEDERSLILVDARGHGRSAKPHDPDSYHPRDVASDVVSVLDHLQIERADFFGYSMGGRIGFMAAAHFQERFNSLILGGSGPYGPALSRDAELELARSLAGGMEAYLAGMERMLNRPIAEADRVRLMANDPEALAALALATADWPNVVDRVVATELPIQLFGGSVDPIWPLIDRAHRQLPTSSLRCFDGLGHGEELRQPKLVLPLVTEALHRHGLDQR